MPTTNDIASTIVQNLALTEPELDTTIGTVARKMIDAVAASIAENAVDTHLLTYGYDIDSKTGGDLDDFCALFGIGRFLEQRATGVLTFTRPAAVASARVSIIPAGTQVLAAVAPAVTVQTLVSAVMAVGQTSVDIPAQAVAAGPSGNVGAGLLVNIVSTVDGVGSVTNNLAFQYGAARQTDDQLRARFKSTVFRNLAGTDAMYRAMALQVLANPADPSSHVVSAVNVLGAKKTWRGQLVVTSGTASTSGGLSDAAYIYGDNVFVGANIGAGDFLTPVSQYTKTINNSVNPATLTIAAVGANMPDGIYDVQLDYVPTYSRNDPQATRWGTPTAHVDNRIDLWVNGKALTGVTQSLVFNTGSTLRFTSITNDPLNVNRFTKWDGTHPGVSDIFVPLAFGPIEIFPATLNINSTTYTMGVHYDVVHQSDAFGYAPNSAFGLVWYAAGPTPPSNSAFTASYTYNAIPALVQQSLESTWRLVGTDCWVHAGKETFYRFHLGIVYERNFDQSSVNTNIDTALASFVNSLGFNSAMQVSDLIQTVHNVPGVDNVRFLNSTDDATHYGIELIHHDGTTGTISQIGGRASDVYFDDGTYPTFHSSRIVVKARNTFGTL